MARAQLERKIAAILAADVVGFSRLMEVDEVRTLTSLKLLRSQVIDPLIAEHRGRIVKLMGDGMLVEFASVVEAVECAASIQKKLKRRQADTPTEQAIVLRIGVNLGDVIVEGSDLLGDGVNIAARLEQLCEPGGVLISGTAYDQLSGKVRVSVVSAGQQRVKNIARKIRTYKVVLPRRSQRNSSRTQPSPTIVNQLTSVPSPSSAVSSSSPPAKDAGGAAPPGIAWQPLAHEKRRLRRTYGYFAFAILAIVTSTSLYVWWGRGIEIEVASPKATPGPSSDQLQAPRSSDGEREGEQTPQSVPEASKPSEPVPGPLPSPTPSEEPAEPAPNPQPAPVPPSVPETAPEPPSRMEPRVPISPPEPSPTRQFAALAISADVPPKHSYSDKQATYSDAKRRAVAMCEAAGGQSCTAVVFQTCGAIASGNTGWGKATGANFEAAERKAMAQCAQISRNCRVVESKCVNQ